MCREGAWGLWPVVSKDVSEEAVAMFHATASSFIYGSYFA